MNENLVKKYAPIADPDRDEMSVKKSYSWLLIPLGMKHWTGNTCGMPWVDIIFFSTNVKCRRHKMPKIWINLLGLKSRWRCNPVKRYAGFYSSLSGCNLGKKIRSRLLIPLGMKRR
jgi:hypothetical protein